MIKKHDLLTKEQRKNLNNKLINFFKKENDTDVGMIFVDELIDIFLINSAITLYNQGIEDAKKLIQEKLNYLEIDLDAIKK